MLLAAFFSLLMRLFATSLAQPGYTLLFCLLMVTGGGPAGQGVWHQVQEWKRYLCRVRGAFQPAERGTSPPCVWITFIKAMTTII